MANEKQLKILKSGVYKWLVWQEQNPEANIDLSDADLLSTDLIRANLSGANLSGANLSDADLLSTDLIRANLSGANLSGANLSDANLSGADLSHTNLIGANLSGADLSHTNLIGANLIDADLSVANLIDADLSGANLSGANLSHTNLIDANLSGADLSGADLIGANLRHTNLIGANLIDADLSGADLSGANLIAANLSHTNLIGADLSGADLYETNFIDTNLGNVKGLDACKHNGPSTVDHRTLEESGSLPLVFLRGCGLPEAFIDYLPSMIGTAIEFYSCFISYSHADKTFARRLHDQLQGRGIRCWLDEHQLLPGDDIYKEVDRGIKLWDKVLLCCTQASLTSWWVDNEIDTAFKKEQDLMKERGEKVLVLIPLNLDGYLFSDECTNSKASQVQARLAADFTGWESDHDKFENAFEAVVDALMADDAGREKAPRSHL